MEINEIRRTFYRFLNEGKAEAFRDAYYPEVDDYILNKIIEIDPESNGDDLSEWGKLLLKFNPTQSDIQQAGEDIAILAKATKVGKNVPDISGIRSLEDLHYIAVDIANEKADMSDDEIQTQENSLNCPVVFDDGDFKVLEINTPECAEHYGKGTMWPWAAQGADGGMFQQLSQRGKIFVVKNNTDNAMYSLVKMGSRIRLTDVNDESLDKSILPQELLTTIMNINEGILDLFRQKDTDPMIEKVADGIVEALRKNFNNRNGEVGNSDLKMAMNRVCNAINGEDDLEGVRDVIVSKSKELLKDSSRFSGGGQQYMMVKPELIPEILNMTAEIIEKGDNTSENENTIDETDTMSESKIVKMSENDLNSFLYEALEKQMGKLIKESELWYGADEDPVNDNVRPEDDENYPADRESQMDYDWGSRETEKDFGEWKQHTAADSQSELRNRERYFSDAENRQGRKLMDKWVDGTRDLEDLEDSNYMFTKENKKTIKTKITESELRKMVTESVKRQLMEAFSDIYDWRNFDNDRDNEDEEYIPDYIDCIDPATLSNVLDTMGWSYYDSQEIKDKQGREYAAYACRPAANSKYDIKQVIDAVKKSAEMPNGIFYKQLAHRYAPEQSTYWIIVEIVPKENYGKQLSLDMENEQ